MTFRRLLDIFTMYRYRRMRRMSGDDLDFQADLYIKGRTVTQSDLVHR